MQETHPKRPSRIYAGCDVSTPIDPLVPVALLVPFVAVWKVREFMLAHSYERFGQGPGVEVLDQAVLWLIAGMLVCGLAALRLFVRGRDEWGAAPLAFGFVGCAWAWLLASWFRFDEQGIQPIAPIHSYFGGLLVFAVALLCLTYGVFGLVARLRRVAGALRWIVLIGPVVSLLVVYGSASGVDRAVHGKRGDTLQVRCDPPVLPQDVPSAMPAPREFEGVCYSEHEGRLLLSAFPWFGDDLLYLQEPTEVLCDRDALERARSSSTVANSEWYPRAHALLGADSEACRLHCVAVDLRARYAGTPGVRVGSWRVGRTARFSGFGRSSNSVVMRRWFIYTRGAEGDVPVVVYRQGEDVFIALDGAGEFREALHAAYREAEQDRYDHRGRPQHRPPGLRVRIQPGVTLQEFLDLRNSWAEESYYSRFEWVIDDTWLPDLAD